MTTCRSAARAARLGDRLDELSLHVKAASDQQRAVFSHRQRERAAISHAPSTDDEHRRQWPPPPTATAAATVAATATELAAARRMAAIAGVCWYSWPTVGEL